MPNDNRMGWIRNLESLAGGVSQYTAEYELGSECSLHGLLDYGDGRFICAPMSTERSKEGLWLYNLVLSFPLGAPDHKRSIREADAKGYYFKDGILGELLALLSLFFRCRFYLISSRLSPGDPRSGMTIKTKYPLVRIDCNPKVHPPVFESTGKNLAVGFSEFLDRVRTLDKGLHQNFILACYHYRRALNEIGVDSEMVFIRLVSAIEALSKDTKLTGRENALEAAGVADLISQSNMSAALKAELRTVFDARKSRKKFVRFVERHCGGFFKGGNFKASSLKIKKADLGKVLTNIYDARSRYLHSGEPMFLSRPMRGGEKWDTDPSLGMIADNRSIPGSKKLPYGYFFEGLVRQCLLNYLKNNAAEEL
jgi:hypothetical protein